MPRLPARLPRGAKILGRRALLQAGLQASFASAIGLSGVARAQDTRPIRLVVPFPAGGATDAIARLAAETMAEQLGLPCFVDDRPGAAGNIAAEHVGRLPADGHTLLVVGQALLFINKSLYKTLPFDPSTDFTLVGMLGYFPNVVVSNPDAMPPRASRNCWRLRAPSPGACLTDRMA